MADYFQIPLRMPPFVAGTDTGLWAQPDRQLTLAAIPVAGATTITCDGLDTQVDWGDWHLAREGSGENHYRAIDFSTARDPGQTYEILGQLTPEADERAKFLRDYWWSRFRCASTIYQVRRITPVQVVGQIAPDAAGKRIKARDYWFTLQPDMWLVRSLVNPNLWWLLSHDDLVKEFTALTTPTGELVVSLRK